MISEIHVLPIKKAIDLKFFQNTIGFFLPNISHFEPCLFVIFVYNQQFPSRLKSQAHIINWRHSWFLSSCYLFELGSHCFPSCSHISIILSLCCFSDTQSESCLGLTVAAIPQAPTWLIPRVFHSCVWYQSYFFIANPAVSLHTP